MECPQDSLATDSNILFADTDIVWLKDPLVALDADQSDVQLTHDGWGPNIGVMFVRPTECTGAFMRDWLARRTQPDSRDQYEFDEAVKSATAKCPAFKVGRLMQKRAYVFVAESLEAPVAFARMQQLGFL